MSLSLKCQRRLGPVQARKETPEGKLKKKSSRIQTAEALCHKVKHLLPEDSLKHYQENFLDKSVDPDYHVDTTSKNELRIKFLQPFAYANLLKFIGLKRKYCPDYVKAFYYNWDLTPTGIDSRFKDKLVKFDYFDFRKYLDLASSGALLDAAPTNYDKVSHVLAISKFVVESPSMSNFSIVQVKYIISRIVYCRDTKKDPLFYSLFVKLLLEVNGIVPKEDDQFLTLTILDYDGVSKMRYYRDSDDDSYFYLEDSGKEVYDNKIVGPPVDHIVASSSSTPSTSLFVEFKSYVDELVGRILYDNQIR
ncbi:hypothetical protein RYX36_036677 [Vicia faba]